MVVAHNLQAINAYRHTGTVSLRQQKSTEKRSSGYRINKAADDAAGLAISEKMRSQIRGLDRASDNAADGISLIQTAEGALNEVHSILQRMNELATQAANDTNTSVDRSQIALEIDQLVSEIDRVASTTQFNTMDLLDGSFTKKNLQVGSLEGQLIELNIDSMSASGLALTGSHTSEATAASSSENVSVGITDASKVKDATLTYSATTVKNYSPSIIKGGGSFDAELTDAGKEYFEGKSDIYVWYLEAGTRYDNVNTVSSSGWYALARTNGNQVHGWDGVVGTSAVASITDFSAYIDGAAANKSYIRVSEPAATTTVTNSWVSSDGSSPSSLGISISGSPALGDTITLTAASSSSDTLKVDTFYNAGKTMEKVQNAIDLVSNQRAKLGAIQNRLEHTIANLDSTSENTSAAESRIRDTDMAKEMVEYSKNNILAQAGQAMLTQANQSAQAVLSLLA